MLRNTTHHNTRQHTATHTATRCHTPQHTATLRNTLQHIATQCNTLQHTATGRIVGRATYFLTSGEEVGGDGKRGGEVVFFKLGDPSNLDVDHVHFAA